MPAKSTALALTPDQAPVPMFGALQMASAFDAYQRLQRELDKAMPDQLLRLEGRAFRKKGYWRAVGTAFNLSIELVDERREVHGTFEDGHDNFGWMAVYRATTPSGRSAIGDGACFALEKAARRDTNKWAKLPWQATEHNVRSHAHTRAFNRAVSSLVGFGEVSAEELEHEPHDDQAPPPLPAADRPRAMDPPQPIPPDVELSSGPSVTRPVTPRVHPDSRPISEPQRKRLFAMAEEAKKANNPWPSRDAVKQALYAAFGIETTSDLRIADYEQAIELVKRGPMPF